MRASAAKAGTNPSFRLGGSGTGDLLDGSGAGWPVEVHRPWEGGSSPPGEGSRPESRTSPRSGWDQPFVRFARKRPDLKTEGQEVRRPARFRKRVYRGVLTHMRSTPDSRTTGLPTTCCAVRGASWLERAVLFAMVLAALLLVHPGLARAGNPSATIDQCRNGSFSSPTACTDGAWQNGNLGPENAHFREGDSVPFRITFINLVPGTSYSVTIGYDTIVGGKNAYDYLTTYNRTESSADPCTGVSGCSGSPYHMSLDSCSGPSFSCGAQDRSMKSSVIAQVPANFDTTASPATVFLGGTVTDTATLSGSNGAVTGTVAFFVCGPDLAGNPDCSSGGVPVGSTKNLNVSGSATSDAFTPPGVGHYCFRAEYTPDQFAAYAAGSHTNTTTECFNVISLTPNIATTIKNAADNSTVTGALPLGSSVYDTASLSDSGFAFTGTVTFKFFSSIDCSGAASSESGVAVGTKSSNHGPLAAGSYSFNAQYIAGSDSNHTNSAVSSCEPLTISAATPSIATTIKNAADNSTVSGPLPLGSTVYDTAALTDSAFPLTGTVTFTFFTNETCSGEHADTESGVAVGGEASHQRPLGAGSAPLIPHDHPRSRRQHAHPAGHA